MKGLMKMAAISTIVAAAGAAQAGTVTVAYAPFQAGSGGEFRITPNGGAFAGRTGLFSDAAGSFQTFCIERREQIGQGTFAFTIDNGAIRGGYSGGNPDPIDAKTAYLYTQFRTGGTISGLTYNYAPEAAREATAKILQHAIWSLEGELADGNTNPNSLSAADLATANNLAANVTVPVGFVNNVRALNIFTDANGNGRLDWTDTNLNGIYDYNESGESIHQSQLTLIPLPTVAAMGLAGLSVLAIRRRAAR